MDKALLSSLFKPAESVAQREAKEQQLVPAVNAHRVRKEMTARLVAQEYARNGMNFAEAWKTVTGNASMPSNMGMLKTLGAQTDIFMNELSKLIDKSDIERERALGILWSMVNTSILDFMDDHGDILSVAELKKLPRVMQLMIDKIDVRTVETEIIGPDRKPILDDNGTPYLKRTSVVRISMPEKMMAMNQLAQIMRWVGPMVNVNINLNVGKAMAEADERAARATLIYDQAQSFDQ